MSDFSPRRVCSPHHFDIRRDRRGHWVARDRNGLAGGTFLTRDGAFRYAMFEAGGDTSLVHVAAAVARHRGPRP